MGEIRQSFPGGHRRFKKLLLSTVIAPVLQMQEHQTRLKLESAEAQRELIQNPRVKVSRHQAAAHRELKLKGGQAIIGSQSVGKTKIEN